MSGKVLVTTEHFEGPFFKCLDKNICTRHNEERPSNSLTENNCVVSLNKMLLHFVFGAFFLEGNYMFPMDSEPKCTSKFDFEEKLLEKVVRMEITMETMQVNVRDDLAKFNKKIEQFRTDYKLWDEAADDKLNGIQQDAEAKLMEIKDLAVKPDVVFLVRDISSQPTANSVIKFRTAVFNTDNVYNMDTGFFTVPRDGTYWFTGQICSGVGKEICPSIFIGETLVTRVQTHESGNHDCTTFTAVAVLHTGETATLKAGPIVSSDPVWDKSSYNTNTFMGALIN